MNQLGVVCCHFNFCVYRCRLANYHQFRQGVERTGCELLTIECVAPGQASELEHLPNVVTLTGDIMWQKERLWQFGGEEMVRRGYERIAFMDADVIFEDERWPQVVFDALDSNVVIQPFAEVEHRFSDRILKQKSALSQNANRPARGIAFACRSEFILEVGFYDRCIVGGGDGALVKAVLMDDERSFERDLRQSNLFLNAAMRTHYGEWAKKCHAYVRDRWGHASLRLTALSHGRFKDRRYASRHALLRTFDPERDVAIRGGTLSWSILDQNIWMRISNYFRKRDEDDAS